VNEEQARRRRVIVTAVLLGLLALGVYVTFILLTAVRG
jgi:uncharacterized membrane protein (DUF485 family)